MSPVGPQPQIDGERLGRITGAAEGLRAPRHRVEHGADHRDAVDRRGDRVARVRQRQPRGVAAQAVGARRARCVAAVPTRGQLTDADQDGGVGRKGHAPT